MALETLEFYDVDRSPVAHAGKGLWIARAKIYRKDTKELVKTIVAQDLKGEDSARDSLNEKVDAELRELGKPADWGSPDPIRLIVGQYLSMNEEISKIYNQAFHDLSEDNVGQALRQLESYVETETVLLMKRIAELSEDEQLRLVTEHADDYLNLAGSGKADVMSAKAALYEYIIDPSPKVQAAHQKHLKMLE